MLVHCDRNSTHTRSLPQKYLHGRPILRGNYSEVLVVLGAWPQVEGMFRRPRALGSVYRQSGLGRKHDYLSIITANLLPNGWVIKRLNLVPTFFLADELKWTMR